MTSKFADALGLHTDLADLADRSWRQDEKMPKCAFAHLRSGWARMCAPSAD